MLHMYTFMFYIWILKTSQKPKLHITTISEINEMIHKSKQYLEEEIASTCQPSRNQTRKVCRGT